MAEEPAPAARANFCPRCGASAGDGAFCTRCGGSLDPAAPQAPTYGQAPAYGYGCVRCGGDGRNLPAAEVFCRDCRWLRPLAPDYTLPLEAYLWALDAQAMSTLVGIGPLNTAARNVSGRFGRPWFEAAVNGVRLGPDQLPDVFETAVTAARIIGLPRMPELYVEGAHMWDALTLGDANDAFIVIGSVLANLKGRDLLFVLAREMGHAAAGHGLWRAVTQVVSGDRSNRNLLAEGVLQYLNPAKLVEGAMDMPLMAWARHSEITADRAGLLAVGSEEVGRRVTVQRTIHSIPLYGRMSQAALERQIAEADNQTAQFAERTMSSSPLLPRRLRLMQQFCATEAFAAYRARIHYFAVDAPRIAARAAADGAGRESDDHVRLTCTSCGHALRVPRSELEGKDEVKVRCPNPTCGKILELRPKPPEAAPPPNPAFVRIVCAACKTPLHVPKEAIAGRESVHVRCSNPECRTILTLKAGTTQRDAATETPDQDED